MIKVTAYLINLFTSLLYWVLKWFISEKTLKRWKLIHLCWWFEKHQLSIPTYFIGLPSLPYTMPMSDVAAITSLTNWTLNQGTAPKISSGILQGNGAWGSPSSTSYDMTGYATQYVKFTYQVNGTSGTFSLRLRGSSAHNYDDGYALHPQASGALYGYAGWGNIDTTWGSTAQKLLTTVSTGVNHVVEFYVYGTTNPVTVKTWVDGTLIDTMTDPTYDWTSGYVDLQMQSGDSTWIGNITAFFINNTNVTPSTLMSSTFSLLGVG